MIDLHLDPGSGVATYLQIAQQVKHALRLGLLMPGDRLPTIKEVVTKLAINPNTVHKAYRELEHEGLVVGRPGMGTFVQRSLGGAPPSEYVRLRHDLTQWVRNGREAGLGQEDLEALIASVLNQSFREETA
ncbi:GntR family transcriptional regulator [Nonomuraea solani]|uniref:GntR family transcriptional regulator n=1 Tax=Nonomuraea solani TaxID=1144553 RepID=A0A1H6F225_9ACTN|nr:GntR family transcriptional regulator [Nonomuraea solani]SEH03249.1 GntR family transcriptional regulator [Nonomuraea solani]